MKDKYIKYGVLVFSIAMISFLILYYIDTIAMQINVVQTAGNPSASLVQGASDEASGSETSVPSSGAETTSKAGTSKEGTASSKSTSSAAVTQNIYFDINTVTKEQLCLINGIGDVIAQKIIDKRNELGRFTSLEQLKTINGIGDKRYAVLQEHLYISE